VGGVLAGGAAGRGAVDDAPVPLVLAGGLAPLDLDGVVADLDAMCAVACRVEVRGAVALAHGPEGAVGVFASVAHWAVSIFLMALRAVGSGEMPRTRRAAEKSCSVFICAARAATFRVIFLTWPRERFGAYSAMRFSNPVVDMGGLLGFLRRC